MCDLSSSQTQQHLIVKTSVYTPPTLGLHTSHPGFTQLYPVQWDIHGNNSPLNCLFNLYTYSFRFFKRFPCEIPITDKGYAI